MVRAMCGVQLKHKKRTRDLIFLLGLNETIDQLAMENSVHWYGHVLRKADGHILRRVLILRLKINGRKGSRRGRGKCRLRKKV